MPVAVSLLPFAFSLRQPFFSFSYLFCLISHCHYRQTWRDTGERWPLQKLDNEMRNEEVRKRIKKTHLRHGPLSITILKVILAPARRSRIAWQLKTAMNSTTTLRSTTVFGIGSYSIVTLVRVIGFYACPRNPCSSFPEFGITWSSFRVWWPFSICWKSGRARFMS